MPVINSDGTVGWFWFEYPPTGEYLGIQRSVYPMAYESGDGFKSTNRAPMMAHKRSMERKSMAGGAGGVDPLAQPAQGEAMGGEDGAQVAEEHGPAHEVHMMHDHEGGQHHVHSMHPDGHEHHSDHASVEEAHEHGKKLAGAGMMDKEEGMEHEDEPQYE